MKDAQGCLTWIQERDVDSAQGEVFGFPARIDQPGRRSGREAEHGRRGPAHAPMVPRRCQNAHMSTLKQTLQSDLTTSMKARDEVTSATIRMVLTAITNEEVSGKQARELTDDDVLTVLGREAKKRREAAEAYTSANRPELADREEAELAVIARYLPQQLDEAEVRTIVDAAVAEVTASGATGGAAMGAVMKIVQPQVKGRADGGMVASLVKSALGM